MEFAGQAVCSRLHIAFCFDSATDRSAIADHLARVLADSYTL
jgi:hypothetical protein